MGLPPQLVWWDLDCRQQLQCRREQRSFLLVRGLGGAQDICAISVFRSPWPIYLSLSLPLPSHRRGSVPIRYSPFSSVWKRSPSISSTSGTYHMPSVTGPVYTWRGAGWKAGRICLQSSPQSGPNSSIRPQLM